MKIKHDIVIPYLLVIVALVLGLLMIFLCTKANAEEYTFPTGRCNVLWSDIGLYTICAITESDVVAPESENFWVRTSQEVYVGVDPKPWKYFCDLNSQKKDTGDMIYPVSSIICEGNGVNQIISTLSWDVLPYEPKIGEIIRYGIKLNTLNSSGIKTNYKFPDTLSNDPITFASIELTEANRLGSPTQPDKPGTPIVESGLVLTWNQQDDAEWFWVYPTRDDAELGKIKVIGNQWELDPILVEGTSKYKFEVSADATNLDESERSDPFETWIVIASKTECPTCPTCPDPIECPPIEECPDCPTGTLPQIQEITVRCQ